MKRSLFLSLFLIMSIVVVCSATDIFFEDFEAGDGGLIGTLDWEWGSFAWSGASCEYDNFPPAAAYSGSSMWGTVLNDCYSNLANNSGYDTCVNGDPSDDCILTLEVDLTGYTDVTLSFYEWVDVYLQWDWAELLANGNVLMQHCGGSFVEPTEWVEQVIDLSAYAGGMLTLEFHMMSSAVVEHAGWYIDDIHIYSGSTTTPTPGPSPTPTMQECIHDGDVTLDDVVTAGDAQLAFQIALGTVMPSFEEECAADCNGDEDVTAGDAQAIFMVALGTGTCVDPITM